MPHVADVYLLETCGPLLKALSQSLGLECGKGWQGDAARMVKEELRGVGVANHLLRVANDGCK